MSWRYGVSRYRSTESSTFSCQYAVDEWLGLFATSDFSYYLVWQDSSDPSPRIRSCGTQILVWGLGAAYVIVFAEAGHIWGKEYETLRFDDR